MNPPPEDNNIFKEFETTYRRPLRRFQWFVWTGTVVCIGESLFLPHLHLPRPVILALAIGPACVLLFGVFGFLWWLAPRHPLVRQMRPAPRRYMMRLLPSLLLYVAVFEAATWCYGRWHPAGLAAVLVALAPALPILFAIRAMMLFLKEESDEFLRSRMLEGWAIATVLTLSICTAWGFLDQFEVVPHLPLWAVFPIWAGCLLPAHFLLQRREA